MNFEAQIQSLSSPAIRPGLERVRGLLARLGHPERGLKVIHVAGSNGKGSVCRMIEAALLANGLRVGMFISPHLVSLNERFRLNSQPIPEKQLRKDWPRLESALRAQAASRVGPATYFEALTALGFMAYQRAKLDVLILETGLGGRFDSTNVFSHPLATVITNISLEHTQILGKTEARIAWEKAGIIKAGVPLISAARAAALKVIKLEAKLKQAGQQVYLSEKGLKLRQRASLTWGQAFNLEILGQRHEIYIPLWGPHQRLNLGCALAALQLLKKSLRLTDAAIVAGLAKAAWPGRMQKISDRPMIVLDGAHNPAGARALVAAVKELKPKHVHLVAGVLKDKDWRSMFRAFERLKPRYYLARPEDSRGLDPGALQQWLKQHLGVASRVKLWTSPQKAFIGAKKAARASDLVLVAGSLYMIGSILRKRR